MTSRRGAEELILEGRVTVNDALVTELPCFVDSGADEVRVDGRRVRLRPPRRAYVLLNKPRGVVCTQRDPQRRPRAVDLVPGLPPGVHCVGRLDADSTGLMVLTNDGELTQYLTHPRHGVVKTYVVEVEGRVGGDAVARLKRGMYLDGRPTQRASVKVLRRGPGRTLLEVRISEGRNREVRRILARLGHKVRKLKRVAIGPVTVKGLKVGHFRFLGPAEVRQLRRCGRPEGTAAVPDQVGRKRKQRERKHGR